MAQALQRYLPGVSKLLRGTSQGEQRSDHDFRSTALPIFEGAAHRRARLDDIIGNGH